MSTSSTLGSSSTGVLGAMFGDGGTGSTVGFGHFLLCSCRFIPRHFLVFVGNVVYSRVVVLKRGILC